MKVIVIQEEKPTFLLKDTNNISLLNIEGKKIQDIEMISNDYKNLLVLSGDGVKNQIEGGIIQATSCTLIEEVNFDGEIISATDWENYPIIKFKQTPQIQVELIDRPEEPFLGVGEAAHGPTAAAISNALFTAMNIRIKQLPITRERIISSLNT